MNHAFKQFPEAMKLDYEALAKRQGGKVCAICGLDEFEMRYKSKRRLHMDHDHKTGKWRGLLCGNCNTMLGHAKDNPTTLLKAIQYLKGNLPWQKKLDNSEDPC